MKFLSSFLFASLLMAASASAQWVSKTYSLVAGWNGVWLSGDASYTTMADLFSAYPNVTQVWRWNPNPDKIAFTQTPSDPTTSSDEWTIWNRNDPTEQQLTRMVGNSSYLVYCAATTSLTLKQLAQPPAATWLISGSNFLGFPAGGTGSTAPTLSTYFASFPSASTTVLSSTAKIYKYIGGELSPTNPLQVVAGTERLDANKAYWFNVATVGNFTAPVEYEVPSSSGLAFGRTVSAMTVGVTNRLTSSVTLTVSLESSESAPASQPAVAGGVPLTVRTFNSTTNAYDESAMGSSYTVTIPASGRANLDFGINRAALTGASSAFYASILRIKDSANVSDVRLPVSAQPATPAGLWVCQANVSNVNSTLPNTGSTTSQSFPLIFLTHMDSNGTARLLRQAFVGQLATAGNPIGITTTESHLLAYASTTVKPNRYFSCLMPSGQPVITGTGSFAAGNSMVWTVFHSFDDPTNPFVHSYHPDHDNLDAKYLPLGNGKESYSVTRTCSFAFTSAPPDGTKVLGWGSTVLGGTYTETLTGLNSKPLNVSGTFAMRRISEISSIDITP